MKFEEYSNTIDVSKFPQTFVYFLLKGDEVVYVGQTRNGMARPLSHKANKDFDSIYIMPCDEKMLGIVEGQYIVKYNPMYNKTLDSESYYSMLRARNMMRRICNLADYTISTLKKDCKELGITTVTLNRVTYIRREDLLKIMSAYEGITWQYSE